MSRTQPVAGRAIIIEHPAEGFAQANLDIARTLAAAVGAEVERLAPGGRVLELFSGCGWLTAAAAQRGRSVVAVECHAVSVAALRRNVVRHDLSVEVLERSAFGAADELLRDEPACVVLDPPREGALQITRAIAHHASAAGPGVLYVSCDLATLLRDVAPLLEAGMSLERATIFEMFPHTPHAEYVVALRPPDVHGKTC